MREATALARWSTRPDWPDAPTLRPADDGLINETLLVHGPDGPIGVLQWVNPIFSPRVNEDIATVTAHLAARALATPRLLPTADGALWVPDAERDGCWRMLSYMPGRTVHTVSSPALARSAGALVGRFHAALADLDTPLVAPPRHAHDTPARMAELQAALDGAAGDPMEDRVAPLAEEILAGWQAWAGDLDQPHRTCHGDLKISNLRFAAEGDEALCLLDLDTVGPMPLSVELGDAWRSWCNPAGESDPDAVRFELDLFTASVQGWLSTAPPLSDSERENLVGGIERICLELAARFATDALKRTYFREDRTAFPEPGRHNLVRATAQLRLARAARDARPACEAAVAAALATAPNRVKG